MVGNRRGVGEIVAVEQLDDAAPRSERGKTELRADAAQNPVEFAPDVTAPLGTGPALVVTDNDVAHDDAAGGVTGFLIPPGTLPANVEIAGYHALASGNTALVVDTTTALPGLPAASPAEPEW